MHSEFLVGEKKFEVEFSKFGFEKYFYDGRLLKKRWSFKLEDTLPFEVDGRLVEIKVNLYPKTFSTQAFIDGSLAVEELLPDMKRQIKVRQSQAKKDKPKKLQLIGIWVVFVLLFLVYFQW